MNTSASSTEGTVICWTSIWLGFLLLSLGCLSLAQPRGSEAESTPDLLMPLVEGVRQVNGRGFPSAVLGVSEAWQPIITGDEDTSPPPTNFVLARQYEQGRVIAIGHESMLTTENMQILDNGQFMSNVIRWLDTAQAHQVLYTTGHNEGINGGSLQGLRTRLASESYTFTPVVPPVTASALLPGAVLIVGHAQADFTSEEIEAIRQFVANGGGLLLAAQGWAWVPSTGRPLDAFPMNQLGSPFEVRWLGANLSDPTDNRAGAVIFHVLYPDPRTLAQTLSGAMRLIEEAHAAHPADLMAALEREDDLRAEVVGAHTFLAGVRALPLDHAWRAEVYAFYLELMQAFPEHYARLRSIDQAQFPTSAWLRERVWRTLRDCLPLIPERQAEIAAVGHLFDRYYDLWQDFGLILLDNLRLNAAQLEFLYRYLTLVPKELHNLRAISVTDVLGHPPIAISLEGEPGAVNIFGVPIGPGGYSENSFPDDVPPGIVDGFSIVVAHEVNHVVDAYTIQRFPELLARRNQLIQQAGTDPANYLRGGAGLNFPVGFFFNNPQELFASIANQWFTDSVKTIDLGIRRLQAGRREPINQALFFAEVYSQGGDTTFFYTTDTHGNIERKTVPLTRDAVGHITALQIDTEHYTFTLDAAGNVLTIAPTAVTLVINIKPHSASNRIHPASARTIQVAILTTEIFDATTVDPLSIRFGPQGAGAVHGRGHLQDVNGDGLQDLVLRFHVQETGITCGETSAALTGETFDGQRVQGSERLRTVRCK